MTQLTDDIYCVEVAEDAYNVQLYQFKDTPQVIDWLTESGGVKGYERHNLPPGNWQFLFLSNEVTEKQAHEIVDNELKSVGYVYMDYMQPENEKRPYKFDAAIDSFHSLLKSKSLTGNYAVIKKVK